MQLSGVSCLTTILSCLVLSGGLILVKPTEKVAAVPVPEKSDVKLPQPPNGHPASPQKDSSYEAPHCKKLDKCFTEVKAEKTADQEQSASQFKACIARFCDEVHADRSKDEKEVQSPLCNEKGQKAWDIITKAQAEAKESGHKISLVAAERSDTYAEVLQLIVAGSSVSSDSCQLGRASPASDSKAKKSPAHVPVPEMPSVKLPQPPSGPQTHKKGAFESKNCKVLDSCFAEAASAKEAESDAKFKSCIAGFCRDFKPQTQDKSKASGMGLLCDDTSKAWKLVSKAHAELKVQSERKISLVHTATQVSEDAASAVVQMLKACQVPVPPVTEVKLPQPPSGMPGSVGSGSSSSATEPPHCKKLDSCFSEVTTKDQVQHATEFKSCIVNFCDGLQKGAGMKSTLCGDKGKQAWDIVSKAQAEWKATSGQKVALVALSTQHPDAYARVLRVLLAESSLIQKSEACEVPVPAKPTATLPRPGGHPESGAASKNLGAAASKTGNMRCKKLDMCFQVFGEQAAGFKACIQRFCDKLSADTLTKPENSALCKDKGEAAWRILAKAHADKKATVSPAGKTSFLLELGTQMEDACRA